MRLVENQAQQLLQREFALTIVRGSVLVVNRLERLGQLRDDGVMIGGGFEIEMRLAVIAPVCDGRAIVLLEIVECGTEGRFLAREPSGGDLAAFAFAPFVADDDEPERDRAQVEVGSAVEGRDRYAALVIEDTEVIALEIFAAAGRFSGHGRGCRPGRVEFGRGRREGQRIARRPSRFAVANLRRGGRRNAITLFARWKPQCDSRLVVRRVHPLSSRRLCPAWQTRASAPTQVSKEPPRPPRYTKKNSKFRPSCALVLLVV